MTTYMQCDCSVEHDYHPKFCRDVWRTARKVHTCCECRRIIQPGERYEHVTGKWDRDMETYKTCLGCYRLRERLCSNGWIYGELADQIEPCIGFDYTQDPATLEDEP